MNCKQTDDLKKFVERALTSDSNLDVLKNISFFTFLSILLFSSWLLGYSPQEGNVTATLGLLLNRTNLEGFDSPITSPTMGGMGLIALGDFNNKGSIEIGLFHTNKVFYRRKGSGFIGEGTEIIHISMGYRRWWTERLSSSLSFFSSYSMGSPNIVYSEFSPRNLVDTSARDITEYGFDAAVQGDLKSWEKAALTLEGRYSHSVTPKDHERGDQWIIMLGLRVLLQQKESTTPPAKPKKTPHSL